MWQRFCAGCGKVVSKLTSGKYLLTVAVAVSYLWSVYKGLISNEASVAIILTVIKDYFQHSKEEIKKGTEQ